MFQCRKGKGAVQIQISDGKHFVALGKHGIYCRRPPKLKIQNGDDDKYTKWLQHKDTEMANIEPLYSPHELHLNQDQDLEFICCISHVIVVITTFSG